MTGAHLADWPSRNPVAWTRAQHRVDPYWSGLWRGGSQGAWTNHYDLLNAPLTGQGPWQVTDFDEAFEQVVNGKGHARRLSMAAAAMLFRTLTVQQAAAIVGSKIVNVSGHSPDLQLLLSSRFVSLGLPLTLNRGVLPMMVRPDVNPPLERLAGAVDYLTYLGVTGDTRFRRGSQFDRHNVLTTELMLRVAEYLPVPVVLGEAAYPALEATTPGLDARPATIRSADAVLVRSDGMRIAVEMTSTYDLRGDKIERWADILARDTTGSLAVVFVEAGHPEEAASPRWFKSMRTRLRHAGHASIGHVTADVPNRLLLVRWADWFPGPHLADESFRQLQAWRATGPEGHRWLPVSALDPFDLVFAKPYPGVTDVLDNARLLYGMPHWLRAKPLPRFDDVVLSWSGRDTEIRRTGLSWLRVH